MVGVEDDKDVEKQINGKDGQNGDVDGSEWFIGHQFPGAVQVEWRVG